MVRRSSTEIDPSHFINGPIWPNNHIHVLKPHGGIDGRWLTYALNCVDYSLYIDGLTRDKLTQGSMMGIELFVPERHIQTAIADYLDRETAQIDALIGKGRRGARRASLPPVLTRGASRCRRLSRYCCCTSVLYSTSMSTRPGRCSPTAERRLQIQVRAQRAFTLNSEPSGASSTVLDGTAETRTETLNGAGPCVSG